MRVRVRATLSELRRSEQGIALPVALLITVIGLGLASVPLVASINSQNADSRSQASNEALAAAEAGAELGILRQTQSGLAKECVSGTSSGGWCPEVSGEVGGASFVYRVKPAFSTSGGNNVITVFSVGTAETGGKQVRRQVALEAQSTPGTGTTNRVLGSEGIVGEESFTYSDGGGTTWGTVGTNGVFKFINGGGTKVCGGSIRYGEGTTAPGIHAPIGTDSEVPASERPYREKEQNGLCYPPEPSTAKVYAGKVTYPLPEPPANLATNNSDSRFFSEDGRELPEWYLQNPTNSWNPETKTLSIDSGVTLTLSGTKPYLLCRLRLEGGATIRTQAPGQPVSIWFEKPENCPNLPSTTLSANGLSAKQQLIISNGTHFTNNGYYPGLYFLGSTKERSLAQLEVQDFSGLIYGPLTDFESANGGLQLSGGIVARTVYLTGGTRIKSTFNSETYEIPVKGSSSAPTEFSKKRFVECTATTVFGSGC
jgi:hypothetical protein